MDEHGKTNTKAPKVLLTMHKRPQLFDLTGQVALVTGGGRGIGQTLSLALARFGCNLVIFDINLQNSEKISDQIERLGRKCLFFQVDVTNRSNIEEAVSESVSKFRKIDLLINNAGLNVRRPALEYKEEEWDLIIDTNLKGAFLTTQSVGKIMVRRKRGKIINIASVMGLVGSPSYQTIVPYCASKGGVVQLTRAFALEWAKYGINVNAIAPSHIKTPIIRSLLKDKKRSNAMVKMIPMGRLGTPEDLIGPTIFLASEASNYITGHILLVDGGWLAQ